MAIRSKLPQLGDVGGDAPRLVAGEQLGRNVRCTPNRRHPVALPQPTRCAISDSTALLDHLVGKLLELRWHIKAQCRGSLEVDHQIKLLRPLYR